MDALELFRSQEDGAATAHHSQAGVCGHGLDELAPGRLGRDPAEARGQVAHGMQAGDLGAGQVRVRHGAGPPPCAAPT